MTTRKIRFNFTDLLILAIIVLAALLLLKVFVWGNNETSNTEVQSAVIDYVIEIKSLDENVKGSVSVGQPVEDAVKRQNLGSVKAVSFEPTQVITFNSTTGKEEYVEMDGKINMLLTVTAQAVETELGFTINGAEVRVGDMISVILPGFQGYGYCIQLTKLG